MADQNMAKTIELVIDLLSRADIDALGTLADSLSFHDSTRDLIASRFLSMQTERLQTEGWDEDDFADFIALLDSSHEQFNWGDEELTIDGYARLSLNLLISAFKSADELTRKLFSLLAPAEYENLNLLQNEELLHSYAALLATNVDEFDVGLKALGIEYELNGDRALIPINSQDNLMYVGGGQFSIFNWDGSASGLDVSQVSQTEQQEFDFWSSTDMDLSCWTNPDQTLILIVGQYGDFSNENIEIDIDKILNDLAPYVAGKLNHKGKIVVTNFTRQIFSEEIDDPEFWNEEDFIKIDVDGDEPYLVIGWNSFHIAISDINNFSSALQSVGQWLEGAEPSESLNQDLQTTICVTLLRGEMLQRFKDFCLTVMSSQI